jgi:hypothetical protein
MTNQELTLLKNFEQDSEWFHNNNKEIIKRGFVNKFVAVKDKKIISSGKNLDELIKILEEKGENPSYIFIEFVYPEGFTLIL